MNPFIKLEDGTLPCDFNVIRTDMCGACYDRMRNGDNYIVLSEKCTTCGRCEVCGKLNLRLCFKCFVKSTWQYMKKRGVI